MIRTTTAVSAAVEIEDVLPCEVLELTDAELIELVEIVGVVARWLYRSGRFEIQKEYVWQSRNHMEMLGDREIAQKKQ
jgi:hypothetical protein